MKELYSKIWICK